MKSIFLGDKANIKRVYTQEIIEKISEKRGFRHRGLHKERDCIGKG